MENKRLTEKVNWEDEVGIQHHYYSSDNACLEKLGKLEDLLEKYNIPNIEYLERCIIDHDKYGEIAEQLGCPLDVVLKALKYGIYQEDGGRRKLPFIEYNSGTNKFYFGFGTYCNVEDYKKTWWLKEDRSE